MSARFVDVMDGYNGTVFAYGQTGSGKSHTMMVSKLSPPPKQSCFLYIFPEFEPKTPSRSISRVQTLTIMK